MEGYINHPRKILGIYTFYKSCQMEDFENISRKTLGYTSVSGINKLETYKRRQFLTCNLYSNMPPITIGWILY